MAAEGSGTEPEGNSAAIVHAKPEGTWGRQPDGLRGPGIAQSVPEFLGHVRKSLRLYLDLLLQVSWAGMQQVCVTCRCAWSSSKEV